MLSFFFIVRGNPKILIEMMYHKIPIITTKVNGIKSSSDRKNCILIEKPDYKNIRKSILRFYKINSKQKINLIKNAS